MDRSGGTAAACEAVVDEALRRWQAEYAGSYIDDITIIVAQFEEDRSPARASSADLPH